MLRKEDCDLYIGAASAGYGRPWDAELGKAVYTHRRAWEKSNGPIPTGLLVLHKCSGLYAPGDKTYRRCRNLEHLYLGTQQENVWDTHVEGRDNHATKLCREEVILIRDMYEGGTYTKKELGVLFRVSDGTIGHIVRRETWGNV